MRRAHHRSKDRGYRRLLNLFADGYKATDGVAAGASSNYILDTTNGRVSPTSAETTTTLHSPDSSTTQGNNTWVDTAATIINGVSVTKLGIYSDAAQNYTLKIVKQNSSTNFDVVVSESFSHPGGGWADLTLSSPFIVPGSGTYNAGAYCNCSTNVKTSISTSRISGDRGIATGVSGWTASTDSSFALRYSYGSGVNNMTIVTTAQTVASSVGNGRVLLEYNPIDSITLNTDLTAEVTCNGGTNWASATLSAPTNGIGQSGRSIVETSDTACTSGTSFAARIKSANNKNLQIYGTTVTVH